MLRFRETRMHNSSMRRFREARWAHHRTQLPQHRLHRQHRARSSPQLRWFRREARWAQHRWRSRPQRLLHSL